MELGPIQTEWLKELDENPELQGEGGYLGNQEIGVDDTMKFCCLGMGRRMLCIMDGKELTTTIATETKWDPLTDSYVPNKTFNRLFDEHEGNTGYLTISWERLGLKNSKGSSWNSDGESVSVRYGDKSYGSMAEANDEQVPWKVIVKVVRNNTDLFFNEPK